MAERIGGGSAAPNNESIPPQIEKFLLVKELGWTYNDIDSLSYKDYQELVAMLSGYNAGYNKKMDKVTKKNKK